MPEYIVCTENSTKCLFLYFARVVIWHMKTYYAIYHINYET